MAFSTPTPSDTLAQEHDTARQLMEVLKEEQAQLVKANIDALSPLVGQKSALIARMSELTKMRTSTLVKLGYSPEESGMQKWMDSLSHATADKAGLKKTWGEIQTLVRSAKELNRTNGLLIRTHLSHNQVALQILQGNQGSPQVYGRDGQTSVQTSSRTVVVG